MQIGREFIFLLKCDACEHVYEKEIGVITNENMMSISEDGCPSCGKKGKGSKFFVLDMKEIPREGEANEDRK
ncbi:MAG TPA: hypothetical protein ENI14_02350 [Thermoplasmatales archaeon]|nr:hypothetical protein [Thermoplasmatales archaeon]